MKTSVTIRAGETVVVSTSGAVILTAANEMVAKGLHPEIEGCSPSDLYRDKMPDKVVVCLGGKRTVVSGQEARTQLREFIESCEAKRVRQP